MKRYGMFTAIESHRVRMDEEDGANTETTVDVEVAVAQSQDEQAEMDKSVHEVEEMVDESDAGAANAEEVEMMISVIKKYGLSKSTLAIINYNNGLARASGRALPAVESLDSTGASHSQTEAVLESLGDTLKGWYEAIVKFLKNIWQKIQDLFRWVMSKIVSYKGTIGTLKGKLDNIQSIDEEKMKDKKANSMPVDKFQTLGKSLNDLFDKAGSIFTHMTNPNVDPIRLESAEGREAAMKDFEKEISNDLGVIGFETKDNGDIKGNAKDAPELKNEKLTDHKWDKPALIKEHALVSQIVAKLEKFPSIQKGIKTAIDATEKEAKALTTMGAIKDEAAKTAKGKVEYKRQMVAFGTRLSNKMVQRSGELARAWINAASAVIACAKVA